MDQKIRSEELKTPDERLRHFLNLIEDAAAYGLLEEVRTTPKPGLVDLHDNGAHRDMCYGTFVASTGAVVPYLVEMAAAGYRLDGDLDALFPAIRPIGVEAEKAMFAATGGVNTHKGIIFSLGIIAATIGYRLGRFYASGRMCDGAAFSAATSGASAPVPGIFDPYAVLEQAGEAVHHWLEQDFARMKARPPVTHGEHLFAEYGYRGIRGEAQDGFPSLRLFALPAMESARTGQTDDNRARLWVLLTLMANVDDTNILIRSNPSTLEYVQEEARRLLISHPVITDSVLEKLALMNEDFIRRNISPGGCADLLAIAIFFQRFEENLHSE